MLKATILLGPDAEVGALLADLRAKATRTGISPQTIDSMMAQVEQVARAFDQQGRNVAAVGSQLEIDRKVEGPGYFVTVQARFGQPQSALSKLKKLFR